ncbi:FAD dependent oxidoreductase [Lentinula raphanica]|nr:FAD dependent oxidoreductase [Lentinula raphanica]
MTDTQEYDVLIVGAGFAGIHQLLNIRKLGLTAKILEEGDGLGGNWNWTRYPGARTDSEIPIYQFSNPELWRDWTFTEYFPDWKELQAYFRYVDNKMDISRDVLFNSCVVSAHWDDSGERWTVSTADGRVLRAQFFILCTGQTSKFHKPDFKGLDTFNGELYHTSRWPAEYDLNGKKVGVIGTGASGVQVIQAVAPIVSHLTVFQRTPNFALPMRQQTVNADEDRKAKRDLYPIMFSRRMQTFSGFYYDVDHKSIADTTPEERALMLEDLWAGKGLRFWLGAYAELWSNQKFNDEVYAFWRKKVTERIGPDPILQEKLAPLNSRHPFGVRRPSLEQGYFEIFSRPNVTLVDVNEAAIEEILPTGIRTSDGIEHILDVLVLATGFDLLTGAFTSIDIRGQDGISIKEKWADGVQSYLGVASATYPNMFWIYGPQSPSALAIAPTAIEFGSDWVTDCIKYMKQNNFSSIVPTEEAQHAYSKHVDKLGAAGLWLGAKTSPYMGTNIPGKKMQMLQFSGGFPAYVKLCNDSAAKGYPGFKFSKRSSGLA